MNITPLEIRRQNEDEETFPSLLSFHYVKIHDKIDALMMVRALQSEFRKTTCELKKKELSEVRGTQPERTTGPETSSRLVFSVGEWNWTKTTVCFSSIN